MKMIFYCFVCEVMHEVGNEVTNDLEKVFVTSVKIIGVNLKPSSYSGFVLMASIIVKCIEMSTTGISFWGRGSFG